LAVPSARTAQQHLRIERQAQRLRFAVAARVRNGHDGWTQAQAMLGAALTQRLERGARQCERLALRLQLLDPRLVLQRGYALITDAASGHPITSAHQLHAQQDVRAALADGEVDLRVLPGRAIRP
jgi:exodeoxyribonuclease VII large subunit